MFDSILKLIIKIVGKDNLKNLATNAINKVITGQIDPIEFYNIGHKAGAWLSRNGVEIFGENYNKKIEDILQVRVLDSLSAGFHDGTDQDDKTN
ncbi:MAG: hypothetical protein ABIJ97_11680 [Bacteroidota bacterium]